MRFGDGYTILIRTAIDSNNKAVINYLKERIQEADLKEEHNKMVHFRVSANVPLHIMFSVLEQAREELKNIIEDYTITQVTLDDVFINFAKAQEGNEALEQISAKSEANCLKRSHFHKVFCEPSIDVISKFKPSTFFI